MDYKYAIRPNYFFRDLKYLVEGIHNENFPGIHFVQDFAKSELKY